MDATTSPSAAAHPERECDLVMKGGITSGLVYPRAASRLATEYRFRQLGGASAGAIAAAAVAAAEHDRQGGGFARLDDVPTELGTSLATLFQPQPSTRAAYVALTAFLEPGWGMPRKLAAAAWRLVRGAPLAAALGVLLLLLVVALASLAAAGLPDDRGDWASLGWSVLVWLPGLVLAAVVAALVSVGRRTLRVLPANGFGLCRGSDRAGGATHLTDWLSATVDRLAGRPPGSPLLVGDLWRGKDPDRQALTDDELEQSTSLRQVDLVALTTDLTMGRPFRFPFETTRFAWCPTCWADYFPAEVVAALGDDEVPDKEEAGHVVPMLCPLHDDVRVRRFPRAAQMPVVIAARLSLSFPILISAVPICAVDYTRPPGKMRLVVHWFSDGGISSNFPMHLFDSMWPRRPTFGIALDDVDPDRADRVWRPSGPGQGFHLPAKEIASVGQFFGGVKSAMQNWADNTLATLPGYRDRIAHVRLDADEGGLNLRMRPETIAAVADRGAEAAQLFLGSEATDPPTPEFDFDFHRWVRYRVSTSRLDDALTSMRRAYDDHGWEDFLAEREGTASPYRFDSKAAARRARADTRALMVLAQRFVDGGHALGDGVVPRPTPDLRTVPRV